MNFYNNSLTSKKYLSLLKKSKISKKDFIFKNQAMLMGDKSFYRILKLNELLLEIKKVKGDIIEFGIWNGNNLFTIKKIIEFSNQKKKIFGFDNFSGFPNPVGFNKNKSKKGKYAGDPNLIRYIIKFFKFKKIQIINDDILKLDLYKNKFKKLSFIYIDCNVYKPVKKILELLASKLSKNGYIAFDEGQNNSKSGEGKALSEFYRKNKKQFELIKLKRNYQPDVLLKKIK
tara:strand:+ start:4445 stop:5134 length:690 start_codon:yes stop_codon:yes gene_type:complete